MRILVCTVSGAYFIAQIKALLELNLGPMDINLGSSGGAIALFIYLAKNKDRDAILDFCDRLKSEDIFNTTGSYTRIIISGNMHGKVQVGDIVTSTVRSAVFPESFSVGTYSRKILDGRIFSLSGTPSDDSDTSTTLGQAFGEEVLVEDRVKILVASMSIPVVLPAVIYKSPTGDTDLLQDGGVSAPSPIISYLKGKTLTNTLIVYISPYSELTTNIIALEDMQRQLLSAYKTELNMLTMLFDLTWQTVGQWTDYDPNDLPSEGILHAVGRIPRRFNMFKFGQNTLRKNIAECVLEYRVYRRTPQLV